MIKWIYTKTILCLLMLIASLCYGSAQPADSNQLNEVEVGRDDPFAQFAAEKEPVVLQKISEPVIVDIQRPELFVETLNLRFVDAKSLMPVIESMLSSYGRISIDTKSNSLIICDTAENLEKIISQLEKSDRTPQQIMFVGTVTLRFLDAKNLKKGLECMSSQYGSIAVDERTNSLVICDTKSKLEEIVSQIKKADQAPEQIMIEVVIVDVQLDDDTEIGVNWDRLLGASGDLRYKQTLTSTLNTAGEKGGDFSIVGSDISGTLHALQEVRNVEILASPRVLVVSGQDAQIKTVEEIPYEQLTSTSGGGELSSTEFKEVGVTLKVKATLVEDKKILMTIEPEQSVNTGTFGINDVPIIDTRAAKTTLLMEDGQVVVMGGLRRKEIRISRDQIPLLGDLPFVGFLFAKDTKIEDNSELMVILSPHIYKNDRIDEDAMAKFNEITKRPMLSLPEDDDDKKELLSILTLHD